MASVTIDKNIFKYVLIGLTIFSVIHVIVTFNSTWALFSCGFSGNLFTKLLLILLTILYLALAGAGIYLIMDLNKPDSQFSGGVVSCSASGFPGM